MNKLIFLYYDIWKGRIRFPKNEANQKNELKFTLLMEHLGQILLFCTKDINLFRYLYREDMLLIGLFCCLNLFQKEVGHGAPPPITKALCQYPKKKKGKKEVDQVVSFSTVL